MLGYHNGDAINAFWQHARECEEWKDHPVWQERNLDMSSLVPLFLHHDGAEMYRNTEFHVISLSSFLSTLLVCDVSDKKFALAILPHEEMTDRKVGSKEILTRLPKKANEGYTGVACVCLCVLFRNFASCKVFSAKLRPACRCAPT